jgi:hypothetical protein
MHHDSGVNSLIVLTFDVHIVHAGSYICLMAVRSFVFKKLVLLQVMLEDSVRQTWMNVLHHLAVMATVRI